MLRRFDNVKQDITNERASISVEEQATRYAREGYSYVARPKIALH